MGQRAKSILMGFVGDVMIDRPDPKEVFDEVLTLLRDPDILFANLESPYGDAPKPSISSQLVPLCPPIHNLSAYKHAGFNVMSMANNHIVDAGHAAMLETQRRLHQDGIATCGAGENLAVARQPAFLERRGVKVGILAFASTFPHGYEAGSAVPGLTPLRAHNHFYEQTAYSAPGYLPRVETIPHAQDHRNLETDIDALRKEVNLVVTSFHWGDHLRPFVLTDHERRTARLCIDRGADLVLGHHHHVLRGIEWYQGKPIFYGLGHFVFDLRLAATEEMQTYIKEADPDSYAVFHRDGWPLLPLHPDSRMTLMGWARVEADRVVDVGFVPCRLRPDGRVGAVHPDSTEGQEVVEYLNKCNRSQRLNGIVVRDGAPMVGGHQSVRVVPVN